MAQPLTHSETATLKAALKEKRGPRELREPIVNALTAFFAARGQGPLAPAFRQASRRHCKAAGGMAR